MEARGGRRWLPIRQYSVKQDADESKLPVLFEAVPIVGIDCVETVRGLLLFDAQPVKKALGIAGGVGLRIVCRRESSIPNLFKQNII